MTAEMETELENVPSAEEALDEFVPSSSTEIIPIGQMLLSEVTCPCCSYAFTPGQTFEPLPPGMKGKKILTRVKELMNERSRLPNGQYNYRFDDVANAIVTAMERGYWPAIQQFIDREEGKVANRIAGADGGNLKMYVSIPTEGEAAP